MMKQLLGWGVALIAIGLVLGVLALVGIIALAGILPWIVGLLVLVGIVMAVASTGRPRQRRTHV